jgi:hypothetical protein
MRDNHATKEANLTAANGRAAANRHLRNEVKRVITPVSITS